MIEIYISQDSEISELEIYSIPFSIENEEKEIQEFLFSNLQEFELDYPTHFEKNIDDRRSIYIGDLDRELAEDLLAHLEDLELEYKGHKLFFYLQ